MHNVAKELNNGIDNTLLIRVEMALAVCVSYEWVSEQTCVTRV